MYPDSTKLEHTYVYRAGATAQYLRGEPTDCSFLANPEKYALEFRFDLSSAGGGKTEVLLRVGLLDFPLILKGIDTIRTLELTLLRQRNFQLREQVAELEIKLKSKPPTG
jgi:hypothetical protein